MEMEKELVMLRYTNNEGVTRVFIKNTAASIEAGEPVFNETICGIHTNTFTLKQLHRFMDNGYVWEPLYIRKEETCV